MGYDDESIVRPPEGRASVGPAMVTSDVAAEDIETRYPVTSSSALLSSSTDSCAPKSTAV
jgi:hypothetical protein